MVKRLRNKIQNLSNLEVLIILIVVALASMIASLLNGSPWDRAWWADLSQGLVTEMAGAAATFWLINLIFEGRRKREEEERVEKQEIEELVWQMNSDLPGDGIRAVRKLGIYGALQNGVLRGKDLRNAKLEGEDLTAADLQMTNLRRANLQSVDLGDANLQAADLSHAILQEADLLFANLQDAKLWFANLKGTYLAEANLQNAIFKNPKFDVTTTLPDGTHWTPDTNLRRFTDPSHPQFWRSDTPDSPAYRGKGGE